MPDKISPFMIEVGLRIRALRKMHNVTQHELAEASGLSRSSIANIEVGRQNIQLSALEALSKHFGVPLAALLGEADLPQLPRVSIVAIREVRCSECGPLSTHLTAGPALVERNAHIQQHLILRNEPENMG